MTIQDMSKALEAEIEAITFSTRFNGEPVLAQRDVIATVQAFFAALIVKQGEPDHA